MGTVTANPAVPALQSVVIELTPEEVVKLTEILGRALGLYDLYTDLKSLIKQYGLNEDYPT